VRDLTSGNLLTAEHAYSGLVNFPRCKRSSLHHSESFYSAHQSYLELLDAAQTEKSFTNNK